MVFAHNNGRLVHSQNYHWESLVRPDILLTHLGHLFTSKLGLRFSWEDVRLTVETKIGGLPKRSKRTTFGMNLEALEESPSCTLFAGNFQPVSTPEELSTEENVLMSANPGPRLAAGFGDGDGENQG